MLYQPQRHNRSRCYTQAPIPWALPKATVKEAFGQLTNSATHGGLPLRMPHRRVVGVSALQRESWSLDHARLGGDKLPAIGIAAAMIVTEAFSALL
jgi:hypothetical protein